MNFLRSVWHGIVTVTIIIWTVVQGIFGFLLAIVLLPFQLLFAAGAAVGGWIQRNAGAIGWVIVIYATAVLICTLLTIVSFWVGIANN